MGFSLEDREEWVNDYKDLEGCGRLIVCNFKSERVKEGCYLNGKLIVWKDKIKTNFHGKDIPYNQCCKTTGVLKIKSVYK